jgi:hypothetical protein
MPHRIAELLLEAMDIGFVGPNFEFDRGTPIRVMAGWLNVVLVTETERNLLDH